MGLKEAIHEPVVRASCQLFPSFKAPLEAGALHTLCVPPRAVPSAPFGRPAAFGPDLSP